MGIFWWGCTAQHVGSYVPDHGSNLCPLQQKCGVLTTGLHGKSWYFLIMTQKTVFQEHVKEPSVKKSCFQEALSSAARSCQTLRNPMDCSTLGFPVHHQLLEFAQTHVRQVIKHIDTQSYCTPVLFANQYWGDKKVIHLQCYLKERGLSSWNMVQFTNSR